MEKTELKELNELRASQRKFDDKFFDRKYQALDSKYSKVEHIGNHVGKALFKLITFSHQTRPRSVPVAKRMVYESKIRGEVIPDLSIYRTQLSNTMSVDMVRSISEFGLKPVTNVSGAILAIAEARSQIDTIIEPLKHVSSTVLGARIMLAQETIPLLHSAAEGLNEQFGNSTLYESHVGRLATLAGHPLQGR